VAKIQRHRVFLVDRVLLTLCLCTYEPLCLSTNFAKQSQFIRAACCVVRAAERKIAKQTQFIRIACCVMRAANRKCAKQSQFQGRIEKIRLPAVVRIEFSAGYGILSGPAPIGAAELEYAVLLTAGDRQLKSRF